MSSRYVKNLREVAENLKKQGYPVSADVCFACAERMRNMESYITVMHRDFLEMEADSAVLEKYLEEKWKRIEKHLGIVKEPEDGTDQD